VEQIADYRLVRSLGEGNHGEFFLAETPERLGIAAEHVAVKVLTEMTVDDALRRMGRELKVFASVSSPYLVRVLDAGQDRDRLFYSLAYYPLGSLAEPSHPLGRDERLRAVVHACRAAHALHEAGVAHRGIKPANVLLHEDGAHLSDLGLAEVLSPGQTVTGVGPIAAVEFLDPGIIRGEAASRASDIWSLGVTLHWALVGTGLYGDLTGVQPLVAVRRVLTSSPEISDRLQPAERRVLEAALAPRPADRPATADELARMVEDL
jgi:serine/threonine protein kinase